MQTSKRAPLTTLIVLATACCAGDGVTHAQAPQAPPGTWLNSGTTDSTTYTTGTTGTTTVSAFSAYLNFSEQPILSGTQIRYVVTNPFCSSTTTNGSNSGSGYQLASGSNASGGPYLQLRPGSGGAWPATISGSSSPRLQIVMQGNQAGRPPAYQPQPDYLFDVKSIQFGTRSGQNGPTTLALRSDADKFSTTLVSATVATGTWQALNFAVADTLTRDRGFAIYGLGGSGTSNNGWQIDDLLVSGSLYTTQGYALQTRSFGLQQVGSATFAGDFSVAGTALFNVVAGGTLTASGAISGIVGGVQKDLAGTLVLSGSNSYTTETRVLNGTLQVANPNALGLSEVFVLPQGTLDLNGLSINNRIHLLNGGTLINSQNYGGRLYIESGTSGGPAVFSSALSGTMAMDPGTQATFQGAFGGFMNLSGSANFAQTMSGSVAIADGGMATFAGAVPGFVALSGSGAMGTFAGPITGQVVPSDGAIGLISGSVASGASVQVGAGGKMKFGPGFAFQPPTLPNQGVVEFANSGSSAFSSAITGSGALVMSGSGGFTALSGSSDFTGGTQVTAGTLAVTNPNALGQGQVSVQNGGTLILNAKLALGGSNAVVIATGAKVDMQQSASALISGSSDLSGVTLSGTGASANAAVLAGTASGTGGTLSTDWISTGKPQGVVSDILDLHTPTGAAPFVLSMAYDPAVSGTDVSNIWLLWDSGSNGWVNAVAGNTSGPGLTQATGEMLGYVGSFSQFQTGTFSGTVAGTDLTKYLGAYGRDASANTVWAVVNHNSLFGGGNIIVVPEPAGLVIVVGAAGALALARARRRSP